MRVRYDGPEDRVSLSPEAGGLTFPRGAVVEVDDRLGASLVAQGTFVEVAHQPVGRGAAARTRPDVETR